NFSMDYNTPIKNRWVERSLHKLGLQANPLASAELLSHDIHMKNQSRSLRRSVLYMPASNERALMKSSSLECDAVVFDFEDSVAPDEKQNAREKLRAFLAG